MYNFLLYFKISYLSFRFLFLCLILSPQIGEFGKECAAKWNAMNEEQKEPFLDSAARDRERYKREVCLNSIIIAHLLYLFLIVWLLFVNVCVHPMYKIS